MLANPFATPAQRENFSLFFKLLKEIENGNTQEVKNLLENKDDLINSFFIDATLLHIAASKGNVEIVQFLLNNNAQIEMPNRSGATPLHLAASKGHVAVVKQLLKHGANVNAVDKENITPLHMAVLNGQNDIVPLLLELHADIMAVDNENKTLLHFAVSNKNIDMVNLCLDNNIPVDATDQFGITPIQITLGNKAFDIAELLIFKGANVNFPSPKTGLSLLHSAIAVGNIETVKFLIRHKANIEQVNPLQQTPLHFAFLHNRNDIIQILENKGANIHAVDYKGRKPSHIEQELQVSSAIADFFGFKQSNEAQIAPPHIQEKVKDFIVSLVTPGGLNTPDSDNEQEPKFSPHQKPY